MTTNALGYFFFTGDGDTDKETTCLGDASLRLLNGQEWHISHLGMGQGAKEDGGTDCIPNVGTLYKE